MANISCDIDEYAKALANLWQDSEALCKRAVSAGADVVANAIKHNLHSIPWQEGPTG